MNVKVMQALLELKQKSDSMKMQRDPLSPLKRIKEKGELLNFFKELKETFQKGTITYK